METIIKILNVDCWSTLTITIDIFQNKIKLSHQKNCYTIGTDGDKVIKVALIDNNIKLFL